MIIFDRLQEHQPLDFQETDFFFILRIAIQFDLDTATNDEEFDLEPSPIFNRQSHRLHTLSWTSGKHPGRIRAHPRRSADQRIRGRPLWQSHSGSQRIIRQQNSGRKCFSDRRASHQQTIIVIEYWWPLPIHVSSLRQIRSSYRSPPKFAGSESGLQDVAAVGFEEVDGDDEEAYLPSFFFLWHQQAADHVQAASVLSGPPRRPKICKLIPGSSLPLLQWHS